MLRLALLLLVSAPAAAQPAAGRGGKPIIYPERPGGSAPRFGLDPDELPPERRVLIGGLGELFHKNQGVEPAWVERVNELIREANAIGKHKMPEWNHVPGMSFGTYACLSYGASYAWDWWAAQLGRALPSYRSVSHGGREVGLNPRLLEVEYFKRAERRDPDAYYVLAPRLFAKDPMRQIAVPIQPRGYAELLIEDEPFTVVDPITRERMTYEPDGVMEGRYVQLFSNRFFAKRTSDEKARLLAEAFEKWGIGYIQLEDQKNPRLTGSHTTAAIGYFCMQPGRGAVDCAENKSDSDWAQNAYFIIHDTFGDGAPDRPHDAYGGPAYRAVQIGSVDQVLFFPHGLDVRAVPLGDDSWALVVSNRAGKEVELREWTFEPERAHSVGGRVVFEGRIGEEVRVSLGARHYYEADGGPRVYKLRLSESQTEGVELVRTPPTPTYRQRAGR